MNVDDPLRGTPLHHDWLRGLFWAARWIVVAFAGLTAWMELIRPTRASWSDALVYLALPALLLAFGFSVAWPPRPSALRRGDGLLVRFTPGWRYGFRAVMVVPFAGILGSMLPTASAEPIAAGIMGFIFVAIVMSAIAVPRKSFVVSGVGIDRVSGWTGRIKSLRWQDVTQVEVDRGRLLVLRSPRATLEVSLLLEGTGDLATQALSSLPAHVVDAGANVRRVLEAVAARLEPPAEEPATTTARRPRPMLIPLAAVLVAIGVGIWAFSMRLETPLRIPVPDGWVDLSPGAPEGNFASFAPSVREGATQHGVIACAAERPAAGIAKPEQFMLARVVNGELDLAIARQLGSEFAKTVPNARVVSQGEETVRGVRTFHAEVASGGGGAIVYALPVIARSAVIVFGCAPTECARVRETAAATVGGIEGLAEPTFRNLYAGPLIRSTAMLAIYAAGFVGLLALEGTLRRRRAAAAVRP